MGAATCSMALTNMHRQHVGNDPNSTLDPRPPTFRHRIRRAVAPNTGRGHFHRALLAPYPGSGSEYLACRFPVHSTSTYETQPHDGLSKRRYALHDLRARGLVARN